MSSSVHPLLLVVHRGELDPSPLRPPRPATSRWCRCLAKAHSFALKLPAGVFTSSTPMVAPSMLSLVGFMRTRRACSTWTTARDHHLLRPALPAACRACEPASACTLASSGLNNASRTPCRRPTILSPSCSSRRLTCATTRRPGGLTQAGTLADLHRAFFVPVRICQRVHSPGC